MDVVHGASFERPPGRTPPTANGRNVRRRVVFDAREPAANSFLRVAPSPCVLRTKYKHGRGAAHLGMASSVCIRRLRADGGPEFLCVLLGYGGGVHEIGLDERARSNADRSRKPWCTKTRSRQGRVGPSESISPSAQVMSIKADESRITSRVFTARALRAGSQDGYVNLLMQPFMNGIGRARICMTMVFSREIGCFLRAGASRFEFTREL
ncbi:hypothetical protein LG3211_4984 [Lysobacter gummosus]|nr:hypothetical protein LG3211_4984 [Lysobacter gummosus]